MRVNERPKRRQMSAFYRKSSSCRRSLSESPVTFILDPFKKKQARGSNVS